MKAGVFTPATHANHLDDRNLDARSMKAGVFTPATPPGHAPALTSEDAQ